ncbi:MAG: magnesium transporter, partial [Actinomycetales bacterium]|nr:magnesium transporter [Actinomycetales bacterium]
MSEVIDRLEHIIRSERQIRPERAEELSELLDEAPIKDVVALVERSPATRAALILRLLSRRRSIGVFDALDSAHQADLIDALGDTAVYEFFAELDPDDRVSLLDELPAEIAERLLKALEDSERDVTGVVLGYPKGSIGRRMSPEVPHIYQDMTVDDVLAKLKDVAGDVETIYTLPVITEDRVLVGVTSLRALFTAAGEEGVDTLMNTPVYAGAQDDAEETARWFLALDLLAMPVVDDSDRLVGILTVDDAMDIVEDADSEDTARSGASEPLQQPYLSTPLLKV